MYKKILIIMILSILSLQLNIYSQNNSDTLKLDTKQLNKMLLQILKEQRNNESQEEMLKLLTNQNRYIINQKIESKKIRDLTINQNTYSIFISKTKDGTYRWYYSPQKDLCLSLQFNGKEMSWKVLYINVDNPNCKDLLNNIKANTNIQDLSTLTKEGTFIDLDVIETISSE